MKITVLAHLEREKSRKPDVAVEQVVEGLRAGGHEVAVLAVHGDVRKIVEGLGEAARPDLVFNMMEMFGKDLFGAIAVVGLLDLLDVPYTGGGPGEFYLQEDKALTKKLLAFDGIQYPGYAVFGKDGGTPDVSHLHLPLMVKPLRGDASIGIDAGSVVRTEKEMAQRIATIHSRWNDGALVEEFIAGREFHVAIVGNEEPEVLPVVEIDFSGLPPGSPAILDAKAKWKKDSAEYQGTNVVIPQLPADVDARLRRAALGAYRALRVRDYGRVDLRLSDSGEPYVIEVNASPYLERETEFMRAAEAAGYDQTRLVNRIVDLAMDRHRRDAAPVRRRRSRATRIATSSPAAAPSPPPPTGPTMPA